MSDLERPLGYRFEDRDLFELALTHRSAAGEASNERLEFLGDAVLSLVITTHLYETWDLPEGDLSQIRAAVVSRRGLVKVAGVLGVGGHLKLDAEAEAAGGRERPSILADAVEALLGAVYLDGGLAAASEVIERLWSDLIDAAAESPGRGDHKTRLQEALAVTGRVPAYESEGSGPDHRRRFTADVYAIPDPGQGKDRVVTPEERPQGPLGSGTGTSKKAAEQDAARHALARLEPPDA